MVNIIRSKFWALKQTYLGFQPLGMFYLEDWVVQTGKNWGKVDGLWGADDYRVSFMVLFYSPTCVWIIEAILK